MKRSNRLVILVGVLLAVVAFVGIIVLLNGKDNTAPAAAKTVTVMIAKADITIGESVTPDKVEAKEVALDAVLGTRIASATQLTGVPSLYSIPKGAQVSQEAVLLTDKTICIECQLQPGEKAIAFQVDRVTGLDFLLQPGDHIDVVLASDVQPVQETQDSLLARKGDKTLQPRYELVNGLNNFRTVKAILQDRRVLYVSATRIKSVQAATATPSPGQAAQAPQQDLEVVIIVFAGTDQDAELIKFAQSNLGEQGALTAILRDTQDPDHEVVTTGISLELLLKTYGVPIPNLVVLPAPSANP